MPISMRKNFGGKEFAFATSTDTKARAIKAAKQLRAQGGLARIVRQKDQHGVFYLIYHHGAKGRRPTGL